MQCIYEILLCWSVKFTHNKQLGMLFRLRNELIFAMSALRVFTYMM